MKTIVILCLYVSCAHAWNVGKGSISNIHRPTVTFCRSADDASTISRTALYYSYGDDRYVEKAIEEGTVRIPLRREKRIERNKRVKRKIQNIKAKFTKRAANDSNQKGLQANGNVSIAEHELNDEHITSSKTKVRKIQKIRAKFTKRVANDSNQRGLQADRNVFVTEHELNDEHITSSKTKTRTVVKNVHDLRTAILDHGTALEDVEFDTSLIKASVNGKENIAPSLESKSTALPFDHAVLDIIKKRSQDNSKPGVRAADDKAHIALSIEGGGMRGATSAGMVAAIGSLGLFDTFDSVYGSSAGSVIGAYMVSRQACVDIYTEVLTAAKTKFISKGRLLSYLARGMLDRAVNESIFTKDTLPSMNISYVLDSIMDSESGIRPLDFEHFERNDKIQPLRIVASTVRDGNMEVSCLGSKEMDFFNSTAKHNATRNVDGTRDGLFACLQTSMTVPAACGPPLNLLRNQDVQANISSTCFDAFCFEPIPYRSAVEEGATHVLALRSRPHGIPIQTKPGAFEKIFAPNYFKSHDMPECADFFKKGGQQYIYAEDYLTLDEGFNAGQEEILVPPPKLLYGIQHDEETLHTKDRSNWKRAHLLPVVIPEGNTEHPVLSVDRDEVLHAVRQGFSAAFDMLAPISGVQLEEHLTGDRVAELVFTSSLPPNDDVLDQQVCVPGDPILDEADLSPHPHQILGIKYKGILSQHTKTKESARTQHAETNESAGHAETKESARTMNDILYKLEDSTDAMKLLNLLPGFQTGKLGSLSQGLHHLVDIL